MGKDNLPKNTDGSMKAGPGRPKGSFDRVRIIFEAIRQKIGKEDTAEAVAEWLGTLDKKTLAMLYSKAMPREIKAEVKGHLTWAEFIGGAEDSSDEKAEAQ